MTTPRERAKAAARAMYENVAHLYRYDQQWINRSAAALEAAIIADRRETWTCFHCGEVFTDRALAVEHFGASEMQDAACQIDIAKYREMEELHARNLAEDTERDRTIYRLQAEMTVKMRQEEEKGYARGLADARRELLAPDEATLEAIGREIAITSGHALWDMQQETWTPTRSCEEEARAALAALRRLKGVE
jgi:hypothetical protein